MKYTFTIVLATRIILFSIVFFNGISRESYGQSNTIVNKLAMELSLTETLELGIEGLADALISGMETDLEKVKAIHGWIVSNITYEDVDGKKVKYYDVIVNPGYAFMYRETNCQGYSNLFHRMASHAGLETHVVAGYAIPEEDPEYLLGNNFLAPNHAWNIVKISNEWYHIDLTWDSSVHQDGEQDFEFLMKPEFLFQTRIPASPMFQLCSNPVPINYFLRDSLMTYWDPHNGDYAYADSISKYTLQNSIDKQVMLVRQYYEYNALNFGLYSIVLYKKAASIMAEGSTVTGSLYQTLSNARSLFCDALKIGTKSMMVKDQNGEKHHIENPWHKHIRRNSIKTLRWIDRQIS